MENDKNITFFTYLKQFLSAPWVLRGTIIVQFILIFLFLSHSPKTGNIRKSPNTKGEFSKNLRRLNIIFKDNTYEKDIRALLLNLNGTIINGPFNNGGYMIEFEISPDKLEKTIEIIEGTNIIKFAEPAS